MKPLRAAFLSLALLTTSVSVTAPAIAAPAAVDPGAVQALAQSIEAAIASLPANASAQDIEAAVNAVIAKAGASKRLALAALKVVQTAEHSDANAVVAVASLETLVAEDRDYIGSGGVGGGSPIGGLTSGSSGGSGYI